MKKTNVYYRTVIRRENALKNAIFDLALSLCSWPRLLLEVLIRKNFGDRHFNIASVLTVFIVLAVFPIGTNAAAFWIASRISGGYGGGSQSGGFDFLLHYGTWYLYLIIFLYCSWQRWREIKTQPGVLDFGRCSTYSGDIDERFFLSHSFDKEPSVRTVEVYHEPALFFIAGIILTIIGQRLGILLIISSILYSVSYAGAYKKGTDFLKDTIDEMLYNEDVEDTFVNGVYNNRRGVRYYAERPDDINLRRKLADSFTEDDGVEISFAE